MSITIGEIPSKINLIYINLDRRPDRNNNFINRFNKYPFLNLKRFSASDAAILKINQAVACSKSLEPLFDRHNDMMSENDPVSKYVDQCFSDYYFGNQFLTNIKRFISFPILAIQDDGYSDINERNCSYTELYNNCIKSIEEY